MDHSEAVKTKAAERYLLNELTGAELEAYEEHYFTCSTCAEEVKSGALLIDNARELFRSEAERQAALTLPPARKPLFARFRPAYSLAAVALLVAILGYQNLLTIPRLRREAVETPRTLASFSLIAVGSRGDSGLTIRVRPAEPFGLYFDIPADARFDSYSCEVATRANVSKFALVVSAAQARETVQMLIPGSALEPGEYVLSVRGIRPQQSADNAGEEVARYPFVVVNAH